MDKNSIGYCGLLCGLCCDDGKCSCKSENHCGKRLAPGGCYQYNCCSAKGLNGCWECDEFPCGIDMLEESHVKIRAFDKCMKEDGVDKFLSYIEKNKANGVVYHVNGVLGDYDLATEDEVLELLRKGVKQKIRK